MVFRSGCFFSNNVLVKCLTFVTVANLIWTILSFVLWSRKHEQQFQIRRDIPDDVILGAPLKFFETTRMNKQTKYYMERKLNFTDIYLSVRTTKQYHRNRLKILLDSWISLQPNEIEIFTDFEDVWLLQYIIRIFPEADRPSVIVTDCPLSVDHKWALLCKFLWQYRTFLGSNKKWFCHFDDDTYVNLDMLKAMLAFYNHEDDVFIGRSASNEPIITVAYDTEVVLPEAWMVNATNDTTWVMPTYKAKYKRAAFHYALGGAGFCFSRNLAIQLKEHAFASRLMHTASSISLPDDCVVGYSITHLLNVSLISTNLMHSHREKLREIPAEHLANQVTLSYYIDSSKLHDPRKRSFSNKENTKFFHQNASESNLDDYTIHNVIDFKSTRLKNDPTRLLSLHEHILSKRGGRRNSKQRAKLKD